MHDDAPRGERLDRFYEARNSGKYVTSDNPHNRTLVRRIADWLAIVPSDDVLDVGCSDGYILDRLAARSAFRRGVGVDLSRTAVSAARALAGDRRNISFTQGSVDMLPLGDASFDKVIANELIEHVPDDERVFAELARVTRPGALVYMTAPNDFSKMLWLFRRYSERMDRVEGHLRRYSVATLAQKAAPHGFSIVRVEYAGFVANWLWYSCVVYNDWLKRIAMPLITERHERIGDRPTERPRFNVVAAVPFALMSTANFLDAPFRRSSLNMGFHALLRRDAC